ncbi:MAG: FecR domain-containing protein [Spirochaetes bacterium]|nr:FecR domain-containing protein [Spirochaetota bacterium]
MGMRKVLSLLALLAATMLVVVSCKPKHAEEDEFTKDFNVMNEKGKDGKGKDGKGIQADKGYEPSKDVPTLTGPVNDIRMILRGGNLVEARAFFDRLNIETADADKGELYHFKGVTYFLSAVRNKTYRETAIQSFEKAGEITGKEKIKALSQLWLGMTYYNFFSDADNLKKGVAALDNVIDNYPKTRFANDAVMYKGLIKKQLGQTSEYQELLAKVEGGGYPDIHVYWIPTSQYVRAKDAVNYLLRGIPFSYGGASYAGGGSASAAAPVAKASIADMKGTVAVTAKGVDRKAKVGSFIVTGDDIATEADGDITVDMKTIGVMQLKSGSTVKVIELSLAKKKAVLQITKGTALFAVPKLDKNAQFSVQGSAALIAVTGTAFVVNDDGTGTKVSVLRGSVNFTNDAGGVTVADLQDGAAAASNAAPAATPFTKASIDVAKQLLDINGVDKFESKDAMNDKIERITMRFEKEEAEKAAADAKAAAAAAEAAKAAAEAKSKADADARAKAEAAKAASDKEAADAKAAKAKAESDKAAAEKAKVAAEKAKADAEAKAKAAATTTTTTTTKPATTTTTTTTATTNKTTAPAAKKKTDDDW